MDADCAKSSCVVVTLISLVVFIHSWASLQPTEMGLYYNTYTGFVDKTQTYFAGRHLLGPGRDFIVFPANEVLLMMSDDPLAQAPPVDARTGRDASDPDSGGQPVKLSLSFLYKLEPSKLGNIYKAFSTQYEARYIQYARQSLSNVAQRYDPTQFWTHRSEIADAMFKAVRDSLASEGGATVLSLQLLKVGFSDKYENSIVNIQLATQKKTTTEYQKQVVKVLKEIDILESQTNATIVEINAKAAAEAKIIINNATATGFHLTQDAKTSSYKSLRDKLGFSTAELVDYVRIKSVRTHNSDSLVLGMEAPFN